VAAVDRPADRVHSVRGFFAWAALLAVLSWGGVSHERERALSNIPLVATPGRLFDEVRSLLTNDGDILRYYAYANAALGRPYQRGFVRPFSEWMAVFAAGGPSDPDLEGIVQPAAPLVPYRDYLVEYPPGFFLWVLPLALLLRSPAAYTAAFAGLMAAALTFALLLCRRLLSRLDASGSLGHALPGAAAAGLGLLGVVCTHRLDAVVSLLLCAAVWAASARRPGWSGAALGLAIATKLVPALLAPLLLAYAMADAVDRPGVPKGRAAWAAGGRFSLAAAAVGLLAFAPAVALGGAGCLDLLRYHALRPAQAESTAAALIGIASAFVPSIATASYTFGSLNLNGPAAARVASVCTGLGLLAVTAALAVALGRVLRAASAEERLGALLDGIAGVFLAFIAFSKVLSPQYLVWLLPLILAAALRRGRWTLTLTLVAFGLTQILYPYAFGALARLQTWSFALVLARNLLLMALAAVILPPPSPRAAPSAALA
jgi:hypothetical protein